MRITLEDWHNGWWEVELGLAADEIQTLIDLLEEIKKDPEQHFHATSDYVGSGGIGRVTFSVRDPGQSDNAHLTGPALAPGDRIPGASHGEPQ